MATRPARASRAKKRSPVPLIPGRELEDWRAAETEIDTLLTRGETPTLCGS